MKYRAVIVTPRANDWRVKIELVEPRFPEWLEKSDEDILAEFTFPVRTFEAAERLVEEINDAC